MTAGPQSLTVSKPLFNTQNVPDGKHRTPSTCPTVTRPVLWNELTLAVQQVSLCKKATGYCVAAHFAALEWKLHFVGNVAGKLWCYWKSLSHDGNIDRSLWILLILAALKRIKRSEVQERAWVMINARIVLMLNNPSNFNALTIIKLEPI